MTLQPITPVIVRTVGAPTKELGVVDVILQAIGLTGVILVASILLGLGLAAVFIWYRDRHPSNPWNGEAAGRYRFHLNG